MGVPNEAHIRISSLPAMSAYESDERSPLTEEKETHLRSRTLALSKYIDGGDAFHERTKCTYEDEELYQRITPKAENHCTTRSALLSKYAYRYITRIRRHPRVKRAYEDEGPIDESHCTGEVHLQLRPSHLRRSTEMTANERKI